MSNTPKTFTDDQTGQQYEINADLFKWLLDNPTGATIKPINSVINGSGLDVYTCTNCNKTFKQSTTPVACLVLHQEGQCCHYGLKPIKAEAEKHRWFVTIKDDLHPDWDYLYGKGVGDLTEAQAEALADAINALVEYVQYPITGDLSDKNPAWTAHTRLNRLVEDTRKALQGEQ